jgi:hypothetical protein
MPILNTDNETMDRVRELARAYGPARTARMLRLDRGAVLSIMAGLRVRRSTLALARESLVQAGHS